MSSEYDDSLKLQMRYKCIETLVTYVIKPTVFKCDIISISWTGKHGKLLPLLRETASFEFTQIALIFMSQYIAFVKLKAILWVD